MTATDKGFIIIGAFPALPPLEELDVIVDKLDAYRERLQRWRDQERSLCDYKIYVKSDDTFYDVEIIRQTRKCYFVRLACGTEHCLPSILFDSYSGLGCQGAKVSSLRWSLGC